MRVAAIVASVLGLLAAPAAAEPPRIKLDRVVAFGELRATKVRPVLARLTKQFAACHTERQRVARVYGGTISVAFTITADGAVDQPAASGLDPDVAACVSTALAAAVFPSRTGPTAVAFAAGFRVRADKVRARVAALAHADGVDDSGMDAVALAERIYQAHERELASHVLSASGSSGGGMSDVVSVGGYAGIAPRDPAPPPTHTPAPVDLSLGIILAHRDALRACLSPTTTSVRFSLTIAESGTASSTDVLTPRDPALSTCLATAASAIHFPSLPGGTELLIVLDRADETATAVTSR